MYTQLYKYIEKHWSHGEVICIKSETQNLTVCNSNTMVCDQKKHEAKGCGST